MAAASQDGRWEEQEDGGRRGRAAAGNSHRASGMGTSYFPVSCWLPASIGPTSASEAQGWAPAGSNAGLVLTI